MASQTFEVDAETAAKHQLLDDQDSGPARGEGSVLAAHGLWQFAGGAALLLAAAAGVAWHTMGAAHGQGLPHRSKLHSGQVQELFVATPRGDELAVFDMTHWHCVSKCPEGHCCTEMDCAWACRDSPLCATTTWEGSTFQCRLYGHPDTVPPATVAPPQPAAPAAMMPPVTTPLPAIPPVGGQCVGPGKDCRGSACCTEQGAQCFEKDASWAMCKAECNAASGWSCKAIGSRAPRKLSCSWAGEDCSLTKLCCNPNLKCIRKDIQTAFCTTQAGPDWDGAQLGGARTEFAVLAAPVGKPQAGTGTFCFAAVLPGSPEEQLLAAARERQTGIFGCSAHKVYHSEHCKFVHQGEWSSAVNTDVFIKVWEQVRDDGVYKQMDWVIKVDPDTVFFADRLQSHLQNLHAPADTPVYIKNCAVGFGFMGAIEVVSKTALLKFFDNYKDCRRTMGSFSGEDGFVKGCMDMCGIGFMTDTTILRHPWDSTTCSDGAQVAFHPRKTVDKWISCFNVATR